MTKAILGVVAGALYLTGVAWLIDREGQSYRRSLRASRAEALRARLVEDARPPATVAGRGATAPEPVKRPPAAATLPPTVRPNEADRGRATPPAPRANSEVPKKSDLPPPAAKTAPDRAADPTKGLARAATPAPRAAPAVPPIPAIPAELAKKDPLTLSEDEERTVGDAVHEVVLQRHKELISGSLMQRVRDAARPLLAARRRKDVDYRFTLLDSPSINTFSHLGGYIYVNRGLFNLVSDDTELQFVLAREIAHVDLKHGAAEVSRALKAARSDGPGLVARFYHQIALGYGPDRQYAADAWAFQQLIRLGHTRREALGFLRKFIGYAEQFAERHRVRSERSKPATGPEDAIQDIENHWRSAPSSVERLDRLEAAAGAQ